MDELIYLSPGKLAQFSRTKGSRFGIKEITGRLPTPIGSAELTVTGATDDLRATIRRLNEVKRALEQSGRAPRWFEDDGVEPGDWIEFEFTARYGEIAESEQTLFFVVQSECSAVRLVLYGSPHNRVGRPAGADAGFWGSEIGYLTSFLDLLAAADRRAASFTDSDHVRRGLETVLAELSRPFVASAYVEGWARAVVTVGTEPSRTIIATPLYVRHFARDDQ